MKSWKTTLGGSLSALGTALMGGGILPQLSGTSSKLLTGLTVAGFVLTALGTFFAHLFAADQTDVINQLTAQQNINVKSLETKQDKPGSGNPS
jgi:hypothetical protein